MPVVEVYCKEHGTQEQLVFGMDVVRCPVCGAAAIREVSRFCPVSGDGGPLTKVPDCRTDIVRGPIGSPQRAICEKELREGRQIPLRGPSPVPDRQEWASMSEAAQSEFVTGGVHSSPGSLEKAINDRRR